MNVILLGATRGMGRALARKLVQEGHALCILGRDAESISRSAADLRIRAGKEVPFERCDLAEPEGFAAALAAAKTKLQSVDAVVVTAGAFGTQEALEAAPETLKTVLEINFVNTVLFCEQARHLLLGEGGGTLCVFSSVAGDRGRGSAGLYGASKAGLSAYLESLDHRYFTQGLRVVTFKPGFVHTDMTAGLKPPPFAGQAEAVANDAYKALIKPKAVVYAPGIWRWVMQVVKRLPRSVMRRVSF